MRRRLAPLALLLALLALVLARPEALAAADGPPPFEARAVIVANGADGEILFERNADRRLPMASITKVMTALLAIEEARPGQMVTVAGRAPSIGEATIQLEPGERLPVRDLLKAALVQSANDAAFALATHLGDGRAGAFVRRMNERARELGLEDTRYVRPDGLDTPGHYSSARDTLALALTAMEEPLFRRIVRMRAPRIAGDRRLFTWNDLLSTFPGTIGVKTGHTDRAGWSQVAAARRDGVTIYAVLLGGPTREQRNEDLAELLEWGFDQYGRVTLVAAERIYARAALPFADEQLELVAARPAAKVVRMGRPLREEVVAPALVALPVEEGEELGEIRIYDGDALVARRALVAARAVPAPGLGERLGWYADRARDEAGEMLATVLAALG